MPSLDDDVYVENGDDLEKHLISEVGTIWRGTARQPCPLLWEYGQVSTQNNSLACSYYYALDYLCIAII